MRALILIVGYLIPFIAGPLYYGDTHFSEFEAFASLAALIAWSFAWPFFVWPWLMERLHI